MGAKIFQEDQLKALSKDVSSNIVLEVFRFCCRVELHFYTGPPKKADWLVEFTNRYEACGRLLHQAKGKLGPDFWRKNGHFEVLPPRCEGPKLDEAPGANDDETLGGELHRYTQIRCCGIVANLPASVAITCDWYVADNFSILYAKVQSPLEDFSFPAAQCFKGIDRFSELTSGAWLSLYDDRKKKTKGKQDAEEGSGERREQDQGSMPNETPVKREAEAPLGDHTTPKKPKVEPPKTTPEKLACVQSVVEAQAHDGKGGE